MYMQVTMMQKSIVSDPIGKLLASVFLFLVLMGFNNGSYALVTSGSSAGYGANLDVGILGGLLNVQTGNLPTGASGTAPAPYATGSVVLTAGLSVVDPLLGVNITSGILSGSASSDVDGLAGSRFATGLGEVANANVQLSGLLGNLLTLSSTDIQSTATVSGDAGSFTATGTSTLTNTNLTLLNGPTIALAANPGVNTSVDLSLLGLANASLILNEQTLSCASTLCSIAVNALHLHLEGLKVLGGLLTLDLILGHSQASLAANASPVPLPASFWLLFSSLLGLTAMTRKSKANI